MSKAQIYSELLCVIRRNRGNEKFLHFALMRERTLEKLLTQPEATT